MDKYKKIRQIGEGSFGVAHLARVKQSGKYVVIKEVNLVKLSKSDQEVARKEVVVLSQLKHCNIVTYLDSFESRSMLSLVMDYCDGGDLSERIKAQNGNLFREEQILNWFVQLCLAVKYIHDKNILHRDIKTQNLFLTKHGLLKLGDFGIAKVLGSTGDLARTCIGTPYYLSPEICWGKLYDNKSDIWSMGCVLYELSALRHAFEATNMQELISKIMSAIYPEISLMYSNDLKNIIDSMLKRNPSYRPSCDILLKKPILQNRLKHLLSGLGLVFDPNLPRPATSIQKKHPVRSGDEPIAISGIPFQSAQDDARVSKAVKRPMSSDASNARIKHDVITRPGKENITSNNYNYNRNKYHKPRAPLSRAFVNVSRKDSTLKLKGIGIASRASPKMDIIKSNDSRSRTPSIPPSHRRKQDHHHRHLPLPHSNHPLYAEQPHNLSPRLQTKPRGGNDALRHGANSNNKINNVYNIDNHNVVYNVNNGSDDNNCINKNNNNCINKNNNNANNNNNIANNNDAIPRQTPKVPPLRLPRDPLFSDHEPSPARLRDEERKRQDMEYMKRFREIRLDNLREKFHKKMELLEAMNPITGLPQAPDQSDVDQRRRKLSLIKAQVDARVEKIKKELEMKRQEEYVRESIRISKERKIPDSSDDGDGDIKNSAMTPPNDQSLSSANRKRDQVVTSPASNDEREGGIDPIKHEDIIDIKRSTILKKINDQLSSNKRPDSNIIRQSGWKEIGHCNDLSQLDLEESHPINAIDQEIKPGQPIRERRHWLPPTDTIIKYLGNESMEATTSSQSSDSTSDRKMTLSESYDLISTNDDIKDLLIGDDVNDDDDDCNDIDSVKMIDKKTNVIDVIDNEDGCDDDTNNDETSCDDANKINHDNASRDAKENDRPSKHILETTTNHASEFQNTSSSSSSSSTREKFLSNLKLFISKLDELKPKKRRSSESDIEVEKNGFVRSSHSLDSNLLPDDIHHVSDFRPSAEKVKSSIGREAFSNEKSSKEDLNEGVADRDTEGKICKQDRSEHVKVLDSAKDVEANANLDKRGPSSDVDGSDYEERMKRKRMIILQIINQSFEVTHSLSPREKERDSTHHCDVDNDVNKDVNKDGDGNDVDKDVDKVADEDVDKDGDNDDVCSDGDNGDEEYESTENQKILDEDPEDDGEVMMESMANLLVTNPEDITEDLTSRSSSKKKQRGRLATYRIIIRKPLLRMRRRKKRIVLSSWSSNSLEDLQTMKSLLESYQNEDHS